MLTPVHFSIGVPLLWPSESVLDDHMHDLVNRFRKMRAFSTKFCNRWKNEYLHSLQKRYKGIYPQRDKQEDALVLVIGERQLFGS